MDITILGLGCNKCMTLEKITHELVSEMGIRATIRKEEDIVRIMKYGVMQTPGLVINGKVVLSGRLPSVKELKEILTNIQ